jgi:hypothetical protein
VFDAATEDANGDGIADAQDCTLNSLYGTGAKGAWQIDGVIDWSVLPPNSLHFTNFTISPGATLFVPSGAVIRCTGTFVNNGSIVVLAEAAGGQLLGQDPTTLLPVYQPPEPGVARSVAAGGELGDNSDIRAGGLGGAGVFEIQARLLVNPGPDAGGGGGPAGLGDLGSRGGGSLVVVARGTLTNNGTITADGEGSASSGGGGGAGGIVVLASAISVTNGATGLVECRGGRGENANDDEAGSGGGGGGIIHFIAPLIETLGNTDASAGYGGSQATIGTITSPLRTGGGGGGGCGGKGGYGGSAFPDGSGDEGRDGGAGYVLQSQLSPEAIF